MATADIEIGAQGITARAHTTDTPHGSMNVLELIIEGRTEPINVRLHFASLERLHASVAKLSDLSVEHRPASFGIDLAKQEKNTAPVLHMHGGEQP